MLPGTVVDEVGRRRRARREFADRRPLDADVGDQWHVHAVALQPVLAPRAFGQRHIRQHDHLGAPRQSAERGGGALDRRQPIDTVGEEITDQRADRGVLDGCVVGPAQDVAVEPVLAPREVEVPMRQIGLEAGHEVGNHLVGIADDQRALAQDRQFVDLARDVGV